MCEFAADSVHYAADSVHYEDNLVSTLRSQAIFKSADAPRTAFIPGPRALGRGKP
jgi:hypothetical protein